METLQTDVIWFSPTKSTNVICKTIAETISSAVSYHDLTLPKDVKDINIVADLAVFGAPVYGGRIPKTAVDRFRKVYSNKTHAVVVVVYGNRDFDDALLELKTIAEEQGFNVIAAAAYIGEHSFSNNEFPLAKGRPDINDIEKAKSFGLQVKENLRNHTKISTPEIPGNFPFKTRSVINAPGPGTIPEKCTLCGLCARVCPVNAITITDAVDTDPELCIYCCACVRVCTEAARTAEADLFSNSRKKLSSICTERKEPKIFI